ncbi:Gfo/Idh/MocA family oxidoreductase [Paenibacillus barcinonensis]|uniref:Gfo/Idh/MocA family oxidoreductase n=1 Tax=Paenibacillus barcinonensis TaxID=198119 RepID=A0A2V4VWU0_PAEBA|nr:Gfo/Idh/MocA family oxidoreductase [Paenibacillus barcinonensis]PYE51776.1 virulence factor [Paenibacillus barcinonensis]QKS56126.1 Gfo/Idh/MocA family oxidoreductase [Paenibacillus barcinonensis]
METIKRTRIAIIGLGGIARKVYLPLLTAHPGVEVVGIMNRSSEPVKEMQRAYRIEQGTTDLKELLSWELDAVFVHTATEAHFEIVMSCLERGLAVYVDKPLSYTIRESEEMTAFAEAQGLLLAVGFNRRFAPMYQKAKEWMRGGAGIETLTLTKHRMGVQDRPAAETVYDDLIHLLDLMLWYTDNDAQLLHKWLRLDEQGRLLHASGTAIQGKTTLARFDMIRSAGADLEKVELHGGGRSVEVVNMDSAHYAEQRGLESRETFGSWDSVLVRRGFAGAVDHFLACLDTPDDCLISASYVMDSHELAERLIKG